MALDCTMYLNCIISTVFESCIIQPLNSETFEWSVDHESLPTKQLST